MITKGWGSADNCSYILYQHPLASSGTDPNLFPSDWLTHICALNRHYKKEVSIHCSLESVTSKSL